jgi:hypothetical protein
MHQPVDATWYYRPSGPQVVPTRPAGAQRLLRVKPQMAVNYDLVPTCRVFEVILHYIAVAYQETIENYVCLTSTLAGIISCKQGVWA